MEKECQHCGNQFEAQRITAKYCSDSCKTKANKARRAEEEEQKKLLEYQAAIKEKLRLEEEQKNAKLEAQRIENEKLKAIEETRRQEFAKIRDAQRQREMDKWKEDAELKSKLWIAGGIAVVGTLNYLLKSIFKPNSNEGNP
jgi:hypothetical protein